MATTSDSYVNSPAFNKALTATGYLLANGRSAPGLERAGEGVTARLRPFLSDSRVGLQADAVFAAQSVPAAIFKDAGNEAPSDEQIAKWHEAAWNVGLAPLLWIITPTDVRLYDCYSSPNKDEVLPRALDTFSLTSEKRLRALDEMCGRFATETGAFWLSPIGQRINRRHRVDQQLLAEINALEEGLTEISLGDNQAANHRPEHVKAARDFAQRVIGRCIFTSYLIDRGIAQRFLPEGMPHDVAAMFATVQSSFRLFKWLRSTFNGDLFPMDNPGAEQQWLNAQHLELMRDFITGTSLVDGQGRLFRFRYEAIPVDLISSIYQQFARSSAAEESHVQGLHYTPIELIHLTLDPVFEALPASARIIDPTCGSGAFLVEAFRRLVWKRSQGRPATRLLVREVLYKQLFGIDINKSALGIAAFSLYLAALELDEEPVTNVLDLKFDRLIGTTLFKADTITDELPKAVTDVPFDAVIGNPPWTFVKGARPPRKRQPGNDTTARPRRSPDQDFLWVAARLAGTAGRIGMVLKASPIFARDQHAVNARNALLRELRPTALVNLSALRKEQLFPDATGPALLFFARCLLASQADQVLVGSIPWTADFRRNGIFHVGPSEFRTLPLARVLKTPAMLKAATFGSVRHGWLVEKLERSFPTLEQLLQKVGLTARGQGFQIEGGDINEPPRHYYSLGVVTPNSYTPFRVKPDALDAFRHENLHRVRNPMIFEGPVLLCPKGNFGSALEPGRYSAAVSITSVLYNKNFYGISFAGRDAAAARVLSAILNSSLTTFQLAFSGSTWGLERPTVEPNDLLGLRVPDLTNVEAQALRGVLDAESAAANSPESMERLRALDQAVYELYGLERDEMVVADESLARARMMIFEGRDHRLAFLKPPQDQVISSYASEVVRTVNAYLRAGGRRHLEAVVYPRQILGSDAVRGSPGVTAVRFTMVGGGPASTPIVYVGNDSEIDRLSRLFRGQVNALVPPYLNERRHLRVYDDNDLFVLKPSETRYWTRTAGLNDADVILADHWIKSRHASIA